MKKKNFKVRGLQKKTAQITFDNKPHPTCGSVMEFSWAELRLLLQNKLRDNVLSVEVSDYGIKVYHENLFHMQQSYDAHERLVAQD